MTLASIEFQMTPSRRSTLRGMPDQARVTGQNLLLSVVFHPGGLGGSVQLPRTLE